MRLSYLILAVPRRFSSSPIEMLFVIPFEAFILQDKQESRQQYLIFSHRWQEVERLRAERNAVANKMKGKLEPSVRQALVEEGPDLVLLS